MAEERKDITECMQHLTKALGYKPQGSVLSNRRYCYLLLPRLKEMYPDRSPTDSMKLLIDYGRMTFLGPFICDFKYLYYNYGKIIETIRRDIKEGKIKVDNTPKETILKYEDQ